MSRSELDRRKHPTQPAGLDDHGVLRFKPNKIVRHLVDNGSITLNDIAVMPFSTEDRVQLAQLIGYSLSGFGELHYVSDDDYERAYASAAPKYQPRRGK